MANTLTFLHRIEDEFSLSRLLQGWFRMLQVFAIFIPFSFTPMVQAAPLPLILMLLYSFSLFFVTLELHHVFRYDFMDGYLTWLKANRTSHQRSMRKYFFVKLLGAAGLYLCPTLFLNAVLLSIMGIDNTIIGVYLLSLGLSLGITLCWGNLLQLLLWGSDDGFMDVLSLLIIPLLIPTVLVSIECINTIAANGFCGYYLSMQSGLLIASFAGSLALSPFVINQVE